MRFNWSTAPPALTATSGSGSTSNGSATSTRLPIGTGPELSLDRFINEHGEPYPTRGFLDPDRARVLVLTELKDPRTGQMHRLLTRTPDELERWR